MAHITGGGIPGNLNRALSTTVDAFVDTTSWTVPNVFEQLATAGRVERPEMFRTFNMGVGMVVIAPPASVDDVMVAAGTSGVHGWVIGRIAAGSGRVIFNEGH
jgi:phosphoribosylformylglycinamidine cyclo-ligase